MTSTPYPSLKRKLNFRTAGVSDFILKANFSVQISTSHSCNLNIEASKPFARSQIMLVGSPLKMGFAMST